MAKKKRDRVPNVPRSTGPEAPAASSKPAATTKPGKATSTRLSARDRKRRQSWILLGVAGIAAVALVAALIAINSSSSKASGNPPAASDLPAELINGSAKGKVDAPVKVVVFSDFECPACKNFAESIEKQLEEQYIKTGKVYYDYKHYPLPQHNPGAKYAANAAECAADQGRFWDMHAYLFQEGGTALPNNLTQGRLRSMAAALGLDTKKFDDCLSREQFGDIVNADLNEARQLRVDATPTIFVDGQKVNIAAQGYQGVITAIDAALAKAGQN